MAYIFEPHDDEKDNLEKPNWVVIVENGDWKAVSRGNILEKEGGAEKCSGWFDKGDGLRKVWKVSWKEKDRNGACFASTHEEVVNGLGRIGISAMQ
jgi:hypothetical protein